MDGEATTMKKFNNIIEKDADSVYSDLCKMVETANELLQKNDIELYNKSIEVKNTLDECSNNLNKSIDNVCLIDKPIGE